MENTFGWWILQKVTFVKYTPLRGLSDSLNAYGIPHLMSGSGPTVFALVSEKAAQNLLKKKDPKPGCADHVFRVGQGVFSEEEYQDYMGN